MPISKAYRKEIDGLRALAVLPVILFHAGFQAFRGGFVGVDVFFVISGYLITTIIITEIENGRFSIMNFYERRARRILPALFLVMFMCLPAAWLWLLPQDLKSFSQSLVAVSVFASNLLFWKTSGYFDTAAELKPLLHTWSLAVEEQYYLFFPLLLVFTLRLSKGRMWSLLIIAFGASLGVAQWASLAEPATGFYLLPARGWELLTGVFVAFFITSRQKDLLSRPIRDAGGGVGLILITYAVFAFDKQTPFPGFYALVPTVGTALLILCATQDTVIGKLLSSKVLVGIGLISYSAYLWHQPLFAFARHASLGEPSQVALGMLALLSLTLAYGSWKYIEVPFRNKNYVSRQAVFASGLAGTLFYLIVGLSGHFFNEQYKNVWLSRQTPEMQATFKVIEKAQESVNWSRFLGKQFSDGECRFNVSRLTANIESEILACHEKHGKGVAILGDSHAIDTFTLGLYGSNEPFLIGVTRPDCRPHTPGPRCQYEGFLSFIENHPTVLRGVIYDQAGFNLLKRSTTEGTRTMFTTTPLDTPIIEMSVDEEHVRAVYSYLTILSKYVKIVWLGPRFDPHISTKTILNYGCSYPYTYRPNQRELYARLDHFIEQLVAGDTRIEFSSQQTIFNLELPKDFMTCEQLFWADGDHLTVNGLKSFARRFDLVALVKHDVTKTSWVYRDKGD